MKNKKVTLVPLTPDDREQIPKHTVLFWMEKMWAE